MKDIIPSCIQITIFMAFLLATSKSSQTTITLKIYNIIFFISKINTFIIIKIVPYTMNSPP